MTVSEIRDTAKKTLKGKLSNVYIMIALYTLINLAFSFLNTKIYIESNVIKNIVSMCIGIIQIFFDFGLISNLIKISKQHEPIPYTNFMTDAVLYCGKVFKLLVGIFLRMLIPLCILSIVLMIEVYAYASGSVPFMIFTLCLFIITIIGLVVYSLNFAFALFCLVDDKDKTTKELLNKSKELIKGNKLEFLKLILSFVIYYILILFVTYISVYFIDPLYTSIVLTVLLAIIKPFITVSQYIFYEELQPVSDKNKKEKA